MVNHKIHEADKAQSCLWNWSSVFKVQDKRLIEWPLPCFLSSLQFQELFFSMLGGIWLLLVKNDMESESQKPRINRKNKPNKKPSQNGSELGDQEHYWQWQQPVDFSPEGFSLLRIIYEGFACRQCQRADLHSDWDCMKKLIH